MTPHLKKAMEELQSGRRELQEKLTQAKSDEEKEDIKAQLAELSRRIWSMRMLTVRQRGTPVLILLTLVLFTIYLIQRS